MEKYKEKGITAMCGDGINDSISLVNADIGIAISNGTDISIDSANVVLMNDNLMKTSDSQHDQCLDGIYYYHLSEQKHVFVIIK